MKRLKLLLTILLSFSTLNAEYIPNDNMLKKMIGRMLLIGFPNETIDKNSEIVRHLKKYELGGVILFDRFYHDRERTKNISSPAQLQRLTAKLNSFSTMNLIISVDQEGGKVARLKPSYGFEGIPSAGQVSTLHVDEARAIYETQAKMLRESGINCNFGPVVDLAVNPKNRVIYGLERSYGSDPREVVKYASIFMDSLKDEGVTSVLKHFPGHGSSLGDSHKGFVDITDTWSEIELEPYKELIEVGRVSMIMTAHVFNKKLDKDHPATLSYNVNTKLLREKMGYDGVIISDDLQMKAISEHYSLKDTVTLAINSGVNMLLFGNQLAEQDIDELVNVIFDQVKNGAIPFDRVLESNDRLLAMHKSMNE